MVEVAKDEVLFAAFAERRGDARVDFEDEVCARADGVRADVEGFAEAEAGAEEGGVGCAEDGGAVEDGWREAAADYGFGCGCECCGFQLVWCLGSVLKSGCEARKLFDSPRSCFSASSSKAPP